MAAVLLTPVSVTSSGVAPTFVAASGDGHWFNNTGVELIVLLRNSATGDRVVTILLQGVTTDGQAPQPKEVLFSDGDIMKVIGPFRADFYNVASGENLQRTYFELDDVSDITVCVLRPSVRK